MDWIEFGSRAIEHLAWPAVVMYVVVTQKPGVARLLQRMSKFKAPGLEAEFGAKVEAAAAKTDVLVAEPVEPPRQEALERVMADRVDGFEPAAPGPIAGEPREAFGVRGALEKIARDDRLRASGLIIEEWAQLEEMIRSLAASHGGAKTASMRDLLGNLQKLSVLSPQTASLIGELYTLRNQVAHSRFEPTAETGEQFADSCWKVRQRITSEEAAWQQAISKLFTDLKEQAPIRK